MAGPKRGRWRALWKKQRYYLAATAVLAAAGVGFFVFLRRVQLLNYQNLETSLAQNYAAEVEGDLDIYKAMIAFGADAIDARIEEGEDAAALAEWLGRYGDRLQQLFGEDMVDAYAVYEGQILAANPWEGDASYDYTEAAWYRMALAAPGEAIFTDVYTDAVYGRDVLTVAQKCAGSDTVVAFDIFPENLLIDLGRVALPEGASIFLCDGGQKVLYANTGLDTHSDGFAPYLARLQQGVRAGYFDRYDAFIQDIDGVRRGVYYTWLENGWLVIITVPVESMLTQLRLFTFLYGCILAAWCLGFAVILWRNARLDTMVERSGDTVRVLSNSYYGLFRINYETGTYEMIKGSPYARKNLKQKGPYEDFLRVIGAVMEPDTIDEFRKSFSTESLRSLVAGHVRDYGGDFLGKYESGERWINVRVLFDETLEPEEAVLCFREVDQEKRRQIQERRLLEETLATARKSEKSKLAFFNNMSHDMRTPLNAILGVVDLLRQHVDEPARVREYTEKIAYSGRQLLDLVNDILDMSRMEQGKVILNNEAFDLEACVGACASSFAPQAKREGKDFTVSCEIADSYVMGDATRMTQILNNLLSNAFKFTSPGDSVAVTVRQLGGPPTPQYQIVVKDSGIGMSEEFLPQLFEPYARETRFFSRQVVGTGLGMPIVKSLVTQMSGQIYVESAVGKGSTFTITVPFITAKAEEQSRQGREELKNGKGGREFSLEGKTILLAEDNMLNMEIACEILTMNGLEVLQAWNGQEAVERFAASAPYEIDAVLMDMQMPQMDGCEAARTIRALARPDAATVPIIAVTANAFAEDIAATTAAGMNAHISKPIDFRALCATLERLLHETPPQDMKNG